MLQQHNKSRRPEPHYIRSLECGFTRSYVSFPSAANTTGFGAADILYCSLVVAPLVLLSSDGMRHLFADVTRCCFTVVVNLRLGWGFTLQVAGWKDGAGIARRF
jgi:hypothetical protein